MAVFLLVEPSAFVRSSMHEWLENALSDFCILLAENGHDALRLATQGRPTHILVETCLPDMSGFMVLQELRQSLPAARIMATHWYQSRFFLEQVRAAGADKFIPKHKLHAELLPLLKSRL